MSFVPKNWAERNPLSDITEQVKLRTESFPWSCSWIYHCSDIYPNAICVLGHLLTGCQFPEAALQSEVGILIDMYLIIWEGI